MKLIIFLLASLFIFTGLIGFINSPNDLNINIKHNPYPVNVNNSVSYVREFPIYLNNIPSGTGYYQQLITIGNASYPYSNYNINSQGSNIQFISQNNSYLYAWVQNINTTTISVWVKNFNSSNLINMQVFPEFENLFNANGYLGEAPQLSSVYGEYFNAKNVFPYATDYKDYSEFKGYIDNTTGNVIIDNGLNITQKYIGSIYSNMGITLGYTASSRMVFYNYISNYYLIGTYTGDNFAGFGWSQNGASYYSAYNNSIRGNPVYEINGFANGNYGTTINSIEGNTISSIGLNSIYFNASNYIKITSPSGYENYKVSPSTTVNISVPAYAEIGAWNSAINFTMIISYSFIAIPPNAQDIMPTFTIGTGYYFLNITSIYTNTNTSISNNYFWNGHITDIECYVLPELNNQPIIPLNYSGYITNSGLIYLNSSQFVNYHYNITFKYYSTVSPINYTFNQFYMPIFELGMIFLIGSVIYIEIRGYYKSMRER